MAARGNVLRELARKDLVTIRGQRLQQTLEVLRPIVPHPPSPKQNEFLGLDCEEAFYGGAAGGGKTDALLMGALQHINVAEYSAVIFRRHEIDFAMRGSALDLCTTWLRDAGWLASKKARWDKHFHGYLFASGASIHFGFGATLNQLVAKYQGSYFQYIAFDELTQWPETLYQYMFSRLRRLEKTPIPLRMRGSANPGGVGHAWVKKRFVTFAKHVQTGSDARDDIKRQRNGIPIPSPSIYASPPTEEAVSTARAQGREAQPAYFVPAFLSDNPGLEKKSYEANLARLDPVTRSQLKNGDWDVISAGNFFKAEWFKIIPATAIPLGLRPIRSWDFAATEVKKGTDPDFSAGAKQGIHRLDTDEKRLIITGLEHFRESPGVTQSRLKATAVLDTKRVPIFLEQEPGSAGKTLVHGYKTGLLFGWAVHSSTRTGSKEDYWKPVSALAEAGGLYLVEAPWNMTLIEELTGLPNGHDDIADAISLGFAWQTGEGAGADRTRALTSR